MQGITTYEIPPIHQIYSNVMVEHVKTKQIIPKVFGVPVNEVAFYTFISCVVALIPTLVKIMYDQTTKSQQSSCDSEFIQALQQNIVGQCVEQIRNLTMSI